MGGIGKAQVVLHLADAPSGRSRLTVLRQSTTMLEFDASERSVCMNPLSHQA